MYINKTELKKLMDEQAEGNYNRFARDLNVDVSQLHKILNTDSNAGPKFLGKLMVYCSERKLNFNDLITSSPEFESKTT